MALTAGELSHEPSGVPSDGMTTPPSLVSQSIEVRSAALRSNLALFNGLVSEQTQVAAVVKANAYGHGIKPVVEACRDLVPWFAVHSATEARRVRQLAPEHRILVMGYVAFEEASLLDGQCHVMVSSPEVLQTLGHVCRTEGMSIPVHLKVDTGTNRQGVGPGAITAMLESAARESLEVVGVAAHYANIEDTLEHGFAGEQTRRFNDCVRLVEDALGRPVRWRHTACSAAALLFREADFSLVRVGISLYGHWPSRETRLSWSALPGHGRLALEPALTWKSVVGQIQEVAQGETVGYGRTWRALRPTRLAVIPIGYSDGYPRQLGNRSRVVVNGHAVPVVGRVCMNIIMADVTDLPDAAVGDEVVLIGRQGDAEVTAEDLAGEAGTINYEILARLAPHIPRRLV